MLLCVVFTSISFKNVAASSNEGHSSLAYYVFGHYRQQAAHGVSPVVLGVSLLFDGFARFLKCALTRVDTGMY